MGNADFREAASAVRLIVGRPESVRIEQKHEMKWGLHGWSQNFLRQRIEEVEQQRGSTPSDL